MSVRLGGMLLGVVGLAVVGGVGAEPIQVLGWKNDDWLEGRLLDVEDGWLRWESPLFLEPLRVRMQELHEWRPVPKLRDDLSVREGEWWVRMGNGSFFSADLMGIAGGVMEMRRSGVGRLRVAVTEVAEVVRSVGWGEAWECGPQAVPKRSGPAGKLAGQEWRLVAGGLHATWSIGQGLAIPLRSERPFRCMVELRSESTMGFRLRAGDGEDSILVQTWVDTVVGGSGLAAVDLGQVPMAGEALRVRLGVDPMVGEVWAWDREGNVVGEWVLGEGALGGGGEKEGQGQPTLTLENLGGQLQVERMLLLPWERTPFGAEAVGRWALDDDVGVERLKGEALVGEVLGVADGVVKLAGGETVRMEEVVRMDFGQRLPKPMSPMAIPPMDREWAVAELVTGERWEGRWIAATADEVRMAVEGIVEEVRLARDQITRLRLHVPETLTTVPTAGWEHLDRWTPPGSASARKGRWRPAAGGELWWQAVGAESPVRVSAEAAGGRWRLERSKWGVSAVNETLPALVHLSSGEQLPVELLSWGEDGPEWRSLLSKGTESWRGAVEVFELGGVRGLARGFSPTEWVQTRGEAGRLKWDAATLRVTVQPGAALFQSDGMAGQSVEFSEWKSDGYAGGLRVGMFTDGETYPASLLLANWGGEVYCGEERKDSPGQLESRVEVAVATDKPVKYRLEWTGDQVDLRVNGKQVLSVKVGAEERSHSGLLLEPASLWGNEMHAKVLGDFSKGSLTVPRRRPQLTGEARRWALEVPRFRQTDPPQHLVMALNGDVMRGTVTAVTESRVTLRSGFEELPLPRDRVALVAFSGRAEVQARRAEGTWVQLDTGALVCGEVESFGEQELVLRSEWCGRCRLPVERVVLIERGEGVSSGLFDGWKMANAPDPELTAGKSGEEGEWVGKRAPGLRLALVGGGEFELAKARGQVVVLDFWATWCGPCLKALPEVMAALADLPKEAVRLIGVNQAEAGELVAAFLEQRDWPLEVVLDSDQAVGRAFGVEGIPHTVVVDAEGAVVWVKTGYSPEGAKELAAKVRELIEAGTE